MSKLKLILIIAVAVIFAAGDVTAQKKTQKTTKPAKEKMVSTSAITPKMVRESIEVVSIPSGTFIMGEDYEDPYRPQFEWSFTVCFSHQVTLTGFKMGKYEITNEQFVMFLNANKVGSDGKFNVNGYGDQYIVGGHDWGVKFNGGAWKSSPGKEKFPMINVSWHGAKAFAEWVGGSLPTEAQWEYACIADGKDYSSGEYTWRSSNSPLHTLKVGQKKPNSLGLYDMNGNVSEICNDFWEQTTRRPEPSTNPTGPMRGSRYVLKGGNFTDAEFLCQPWYRNSAELTEGDYNIGFRIVFSE
ncbi:MAG: formylglycine-generating enzyme family protein [Ignavibacteria bacterium]|jgi:formylglycine-generating enzyme required for sulfatase activity|nr:formylglycine-generating enzyme family protein [Ignavibacteria bacterium]